MYKPNSSQKWHKRASKELVEYSKAKKTVWMIDTVARLFIIACAIALFAISLDLCQPR